MMSSRLESPSSCRLRFAVVLVLVDIGTGSLFKSSRLIVSSRLELPSTSSICLFRVPHPGKAILSGFSAFGSTQEFDGSGHMQFG